MLLFVWALIGWTFGFLYFIYLAKYKNYFKSVSEYQRTEDKRAVSCLLAVCAPVGGAFTAIFVTIAVLVDYIIDDNA